MAVAVIYFWGCWAIGTFPYHLWTFTLKVKNPETRWESTNDTQWEKGHMGGTKVCVLLSLPGDSQPQVLARHSLCAQLWTSLCLHRHQGDTERSWCFVEVAVQLSWAGVRLLELLEQKGVTQNRSLINRTLGYGGSLCKYVLCETKTQITSCLTIPTVALEVSFYRECLSQFFVACL